MEKSLLLEVISDTMENRIIDLLIEGRGLDYSKTDIADNCGISRPTLYKVLPILVKKGVVKPTRSIGRVQLYAINTANERVRALLNLEEFLLKQSFDEVSQKVKVRV